MQKGRERNDQRVLGASRSSARLSIRVPEEGNGGSGGQGSWIVEALNEAQSLSCGLWRAKEECK